MKKLMSVPVLMMIAALAVACGKSQEGSTVVVSAAGPAPASVPPVIPPPSTGVDMAAWCYQKGGLYEASFNTCRLSETTRFGWNKYYGSIDTRVFVYPGDSVTVQVDGSHQIIVAGSHYSGSFVSQSHGTIVVKGDGFNSFKLRTITITRCYNASGYAVACQ